jgi:hypothetical protein
MTPKQRRQQDIFKRRISEINKKYPREVSGSTVSERERESLEKQLPSSLEIEQGAVEGAVGEAVGRKKGGMTKKKMGGGMMSDGISKKGSGIEMKSKGGMVRGQGAAIRGTKFKGIF